MKKIFLLFLLLCISIYTQATTISFASTVTGKTTLKAVICNLSAMTIWDTNATAFGASSTVTWAHRAVDITEDTNNPGAYYFTIPPGVSSVGNYFVRIYDSGDGTLNSGDSIFDGKQFPLDWSGTSEINFSTLNDFDPSNDTVAHVTLVDTTTTNTDMLVLADIADAVWDEDISGHTTTDTSGDLLYNLAQSWLNGGRLDLILDSISASSGVNSHSGPLSK